MSAIEQSDRDVGQVEKAQEVAIEISVREETVIVVDEDYKRAVGEVALTEWGV